MENTQNITNNGFEKPAVKAKCKKSSEKIEQFYIGMLAVSTSTQLSTPSRRPSSRNLVRQIKPAATFANLKESWPLWGRLCTMGHNRTV